MKILNFLERLFKIIRRPKTLNRLLAINLGLIVSHSTNYGKDALEYIDSLQLEYGWNVLIKIITLVFLGGNNDYLLIYFLIFSFFCFVVLKWYELKNSGNNKELNETEKKELLQKIISSISKMKEIKEIDYINALDILKDQEVINDVKYYFQFERERGNIYQLEKYIKEHGTLNKLSKIKL